MIARPLVGSRKPRSAGHRDAWIAFDGSAGRRAGPPAPAAKADDDPWVVSYQRGEIIALVQRVKELERRLQRRSMALASTLALVALGVIGSITYWIAEAPATPSGAAPIAAVPAPHNPAPSTEASDQSPSSAPSRAAAEISIGAALRAQPPERSPIDPKPARQGAVAAKPESGQLVDRTPAASAGRAEPAPTDAVTAGPLPLLAPIQVTLNFPGDSPDAEQLAATLAQHLRSRGLSVAKPAPISLHSSEPGIAYYFDEDRDGAVAVERILSGLMGKSRLVARSATDPLPRPGSVVVTLQAD